MKIISVGNIQKKCQKCGCLMEYDLNDIRGRKFLQRQAHLVSESIGISNILYVLGAIKKLKSMHIVQVIGNLRKR